MKEKNISEEIEVPEGVVIEFNNGILKVSGKQGTVERKIRDPRIKIQINPGSISLTLDKSTKREKKIIYSLCAHIDNMIDGVLYNHVYKLKICSGHFPMNVTMNNDLFSIKNFLGERVPRELKIKHGVKVALDGTTVTVESPDKELAGQAAADIEQLTRITNRDRRIFQDGIFIIEKDGKDLSK